MLSEPVVKDASEDSDTLIADLGVRGVLQSQSMACLTSVYLTL